MRAFVTIISLFLSLNAFAQIDTEFWFACPDLNKDHAEEPIYLRIMSFSHEATVSVSQPANPSFTPIVRTLTPNDFTAIKLTPSVVETTTGNGNEVRNTGLLIESTAEISAYYLSWNDNSEAYALKGRNALGTEFLIPSQFDYANCQGGPKSKNTVEIVATEDGTVVTIIPSKSCVGHAASIPFNIILNRGQAYALRASSQAANAHLENTRITSSKPVAVNYTDDGLCAPGGDLIGDQLVPVDLLGTEYIAVRNDAGSASSADKIYILPTQNGTIVTINGVDQSPMNIGGKLVYSLGVATTTTVPIATYITSNHPISVLQLTYKGAEPGGSILPSLSCSGSRQISYNPVESTVKVTLVTKTENIGSFTMNGSSWAIPESLFFPVPNTGGKWSYYRNDLSSNTVMLIANSKGLFHAGFFEYGGKTCSYGYFSSYNVFPLDVKMDKEFYFEGDNIALQVPDSAQFTDFSWTGPNGFSATGAKTEISPTSLQNSGMYVVDASHIDGCMVAPDTFYVTVFEKHLKQEYEICYGNTLDLSAKGSEPYQWNTGETTQNISVSPLADSLYTVKNMYEGENSQFFQIQDSFFVAVKDSLSPQIVGDMLICNGLATLATSVTYDTYLWNTGATTQSISVSTPGNYWVKATSADCRGTGYVSVAPVPPIDINIDRNPEICQDEAILEIPFIETEGEVGTFSIFFSDENFADILNQTISNKILEIPLNNAKAGIYQAELKVSEKECGATAVYPLEITLKYPSDIITQRWNDVLGIKNENFNGGYNFTAFQWYRNGEPIPGATRSYFYEKGEFSSGVSYNALLTDISGKQIFTCDFVPEDLTASTTFFSVATSLQPINVSSSGTAVLYNISGAVYSVQQVVDNKIIAPERPGVYILTINGNTAKIIVK